MTSSPALVNIDAVMVGGGQVMLGSMKPVNDVAVAHDGHSTLAMLRRRPGETVMQLLERLDAAIGIFQAGGARVDEINKASAKERYELCAGSGARSSQA